MFVVVQVRRAMVTAAANFMKELAALVPNGATDLREDKIAAGQIAVRKHLRDVMANLSIELSYDHAAQGERSPVCSAIQAQRHPCPVNRASCKVQHSQLPCAGRMQVT